MGWIKCQRHQPLLGKLVNVTIKKEHGTWYAVVLCELPDVQEMPFNKDQSVGIDLGLNTFAVLSDGTQIETPKFYRKSEHKLKRAQRALSRKKKGSKNREKARLRLARIHLKIRNQRHNQIHQESRKIANSYLGVFVEDLNIEAIKRRYGKSTSDQGWAQFIQALAYKCNHLSRIDRFAPSSKTCNACGIKHDLTLSDIEMPCCGLDRDLNAALNIRDWGFDNYENNTAGTAGSACGDAIAGITDITSSGSLKQEKFDEQSCGTATEALVLKG